LTLPFKTWFQKQQKNKLGYGQTQEPSLKLHNNTAPSGFVFLTTLIFLCLILYLI
uniref:Uncharacterized protein n=1 Tax=Oryza brachyantha TaxID=4533 RepID=J3N6L4_ORYBR